MTSTVETGVPAFRRHLRAEIDGDYGVFLFSERGVTVVEGGRIAALAALIDGSRDLAALSRARPGGLDADQVRSLVTQLVDAGLVVMGGPDTEPRAATDRRSSAYWDACGLASPDGREGGLTTRLTLRSLSDAETTRAVRRALADVSCEVVEDAEAVPSDLAVVVCDDYLDPRLGDLDADYRATGRPWLLACPSGTKVWLGPVLEPGVSACWHCLAHRLWRHRTVEACAQTSLGREGPAPRPPSSLPSSLAAAAHLVAHEVLKWSGGLRRGSPGGIWILDTVDLQSRLHELRRRPQCPSCGDPAAVSDRARRPFVLKHTEVTEVNSGGYRATPAEQVLATYRHLVSPVTGIVKDLRPDPWAPSFVHAYRSGPNPARVADGQVDPRAALRGENGGKGATARDAEVGALGEAVERFSAGFQGDELRHRGSLADLGASAIDPADCLLFDPRQQADRQRWNAEHGDFNHVSPPVDPDEVVDWTPLWSFTEHRHRYLPTAMLYFGAPGPAWACADSNGNAAGTSREDAVLQGLLELVERDAVALWWYNRDRLAPVDIEAFGDPWVADTVAHHDTLGRQVWVLDATSDLEIPVMVAISRLRQAVDGSERVMFGFGAHLDPATALRRAVAELNQLLPAVSDAALASADRDTVDWLTHATLADQPYLAPLRGAPCRPADFPRTAPGDLAAAVETLVARLADEGLETLVLDQTRPDVGMPAVKTVVPGLRSFWARFAPGRLFDVPVRLGRRSAPVRYEELNPMPLFL